jgi:UDP-3-O-[3-hydroxymyristoyl] N-acetylglucosamine deacetylase
LNDPNRNQQTICKDVEVAGYGYWSGKDICVRFRPAPDDHGIVFVRRDLAGNPRIPARVENRIEVPRRTNLIVDGHSVEMVEHVLAALFALQIDNCEVCVDQAEMPGCDGSSLAFVEALDSAGRERQQAARSIMRIEDVCRVADGDNWVEATPARDGTFTVGYRLNYSVSPAIGKQAVDVVVTPNNFRTKLASARTFLLESEANWLREQGIASRVTTQDLLVFNEEGLIDNELRFEDECVRHKTLDVIGDLALLGCDLVGKIVAFRSGHRLNAELAKALRGEGRMECPIRRSA